MKSAAWNHALSACADPERARRYFRQLQSLLPDERLARATDEHARIIAALLSGSQALSELLLQQPLWIFDPLDPDAIRFPRKKQGVWRELFQRLAPAFDAKRPMDGLDETRAFKQKEILRIAARDLAGMGSVSEITLELSDLADVCLEAVYQLIWQQQTERLGRPYHQEPDGRWQPTAFCALGMGKLGGQELNYSSDVDLLFVYADEGFLFKERPGPATPRKGLANHQFYARLGEIFIAEVTRLTPQGALYRIDMRLRPEGPAGPLARSLPSYENYYAQWGQTWERMMLIKARPVAGDISLGNDFLEMAQPFRLPRSLSPQILQEVAHTKRRIEAEVVKAGELECNVKLGRGGIREIEFIVQTLQLLHAGKLPFLQNPQTLPALEKLAAYHLLPASEAKDLARAYEFLRQLEHRLQMENNRQTHTVPPDLAARQRLAGLLGFADRAEFELALRQHTKRVRAIYDRWFQPKISVAETLPRQVEGFESEWKNILAARQFRDPHQALRLVQIFLSGPGFVHVSTRTTELALHLLNAFFTFCPQPDGSRASAKILSDPDRVLNRLDSYVGAYGSRAALYELWNRHPPAFELLLFLFDRSEYLAELAIRSPELVDDLEMSGQLRRRKSARQMLADLQHGRNDRDQKKWIRRYHQAEFLRIAVRDLLGLADFEQNLEELTALADACLEYALGAVAKQFRCKKPPFAIVGLGKLGGAELTYGGDLDLVFAAPNAGRPIAKLQDMAAALIDLLSSQTEYGIAYKLDARLRPDGDKGLLVNTVAAYEEYYRVRAMLWEIQALTRLRPVAGNMPAGQALQRIAAELTDFRNLPRPPGAYVSNWKLQIAKMRRRIERERTAPGADALAIKTGRGGLIDAEFIAQTLCMENAWQEPNTLRALLRARDAGALPAGLANSLIDNFRSLRRVEGILRRWSFEGETVLPDDPAPFYRVAVRCGFAQPDDFRRAVARWREGIHTAYERVFS